MPANGSIKGDLLFSSADWSSVGNFAYVDICTTGYEPTLWVTSQILGQVAPSTKWYKVNVPCSVKGYSSTVYRQILYIGKGTKAESGDLSVAATGQLFSNTDYTTYMRLLRYGVTPDIPLDDLIYDNDLTQTDVLKDILNTLNTVLSSSSTTTGAINNQTQVIQQQIEKVEEQIRKQDEIYNSSDDDVSSNKCGVICKLKGIVTGIVELPGKLVGLLIDALKSLFVPTDDQLYEIVNDASSLSENFGFVGEAVSFFINIFTALLGMVNANGCIELPEFTIGATSLFDSFTFWQKQNVCLADNLVLSSNIDTIRSFTSIVLVCLFINFASRKFFSILSKNEDREDFQNEALDGYSSTRWI